MLAFLRHLPDPAEQAAVLGRRLEFIERPASFFYRPDGSRVTSEQVDDPFRKGMLRIARATSQAERAWLTETISALTGTG